jgi:hypothetical protein
MVSEYTRLFVKIVRQRKFFLLGSGSVGFPATKSRLGCVNVVHVSAQTIKVNIGGDLAWRMCTVRSQKNGLLIKYQIKIRTIYKRMDS